MFQILNNINVDWMGHRRKFILVSVVIMLAGLGSALARYMTPGGSEPLLPRLRRGRRPNCGGL